MTVFTAKASKAWKKSFQEFENLTGFEIMYQEDIDSGETTPEQVWNANIQWLEGMVSSAINIVTPSEIEGAFCVTLDP